MILIVNANDTITVCMVKSVNDCNQLEDNFGSRCQIETSGYL